MLWKVTGQIRPLFQNSGTGNRGLAGIVAPLLGRGTRHALARPRSQIPLVELLSFSGRRSRMDSYLYTASDEGFSGSCLVQYSTTSQEVKLDMVPSHSVRSRLASLPPTTTTDIRSVSFWVDRHFASELSKCNLRSTPGVSPPGAAGLSAG